MINRSNISGEMSFLEHLEELRWHIVRSVISVLVFAIIAFIFYRSIFDFLLLAPRKPEFITNRVLCHLSEVLNATHLCINTNLLPLQNTKMAGQFAASIMVSLYTGLIVAFPYVVWEMWRFISPALYANERKHARGSVLAISGMFLLGASFGYFIILPLMIHFLGGWTASEEVITHVDLASYLSIAYIPFATGIIFELPVLMVFLTKVGIITPSFMVQYRRHAIIILMMLAAVITPPDIFSMILVVMPLLILYEVSILLTKRTAKKYQQNMGKE
jgi:sec-independent protein translocase protein TatC